MRAVNWEMTNREVWIDQSIPFATRGCSQYTSIRNHLSMLRHEREKAVGRVMICEKKAYKSTKAQRSLMMTRNSIARELTKFLKHQ